MWTGRIVGEIRNVGNGTADVQVQYTSDIDELVTDSYNLHAASFPTVQSVEDLIRGKVVALEAFDVVKVTLEQVRDKVGVIASGVKVTNDKGDVADVASIVDAAVTLGDVKP